MQDAAVLLGRAMMAAIFLVSGYGKLMGPRAAMAVFAHERLPLVGAVYALAVVVELVGGTLVLVGWKTRIAAAALAAWCIATALAAHWHPGDRMQMINFYKNVSMAGGFLLLTAYGAGRFSLDRR